MCGMVGQRVRCMHEKRKTFHRLSRWTHAQVAHATAVGWRESTVLAIARGVVCSGAEQAGRKCRAAGATQTSRSCYLPPGAGARIQ